MWEVGFGWGGGGGKGGWAGWEERAVASFTTQSSEN